MRYQCEVKVTPELLENTKVNDEYLFRDLARKIVSEMPLELLKDLIQLDKIDPNSEKSQKVLRDGIHRHKIERILQLRDERVILYTAEVDIEEHYT